MVAWLPARMTRRWSHCFAVLFSLSVVPFTVAWGQQSSDDSHARGFIHSVGEMLFFFAWPSAKYERVAVSNIVRTSGGYDAALTLHGTSFLEGRLWTELVIEVRNGKVQNLRWGRNSGTLFKPGQTMSDLGALLGELNRAYTGAKGGAPARGRVSSGRRPELAVVCVSNPTTLPIGYRLSWGGKSEVRTVDPGQADMYWAVAPTTFSLTFDDSRAPGVTPQTLELTGAPRIDDPATCLDAIIYDFQIESDAVGVAPRQWVPGFPHPFRADMMHGGKEGTWQCAPGFRWTSPDDVSKVDCIKEGFGLVGINVEAVAESGLFRIASVIPGGEAERVGLVAGLIIYSVNGIVIEGMPLSRVMEMIRGPAGSIVRMGVGTDDGESQRIVEVTRR